LHGFKQLLKKEIFKMTEPNKQEFVSASKDANKQHPAEAGEGAVAEIALREGDIRCIYWHTYLQELPVGTKLYTSQTTATQAAVAAAMRKAEEVCEEQHMSWADDVWNHACNTCRNAIKKLTPAEANAALDAYVQEKCMEVAQMVNPNGIAKGERSVGELQAIVRDVLNKNREG
jgi:Zn finger protein HypA/HybF involved in hydrogenase expression